MKIDSSQWRELNQQGLIPGPDETESAFKARVTFCQNLEQHVRSKVGSDFPFEETAPHLARSLLQEVFPLTKELYDIEPQWIPLFFSNYQLAPWHGGCAWIFQLEADTPTAAFLQLCAHFRSSPTYLGLYHRNELIAHELAHVGRMMYHEPEYEEFFAYQSSPVGWRRWLGPITQSSKETLFFIFILALTLFLNLALFSLDSGTFAHSLRWVVPLMPVALIALALGRLFYRHRSFKRCLQHLQNLYPSEQMARHLLYRLKDQEIDQFAQSSPAAIQQWVEDESQRSFRWLFLKTLYPFKKA